jgi:hypothetical protein
MVMSEEEHLNIEERDLELLEVREEGGWRVEDVLLVDEE